MANHNEKQYVNMTEQSKLDKLQNVNAKVSYRDQTGRLL